jgi:hypothetical protein
MTSTRKKYQPYPMALVFDWDGVFQEEKPDEDITGLLEPEQIKRISALAQKHNIPVYIVTTRTESKKQHVIKMLTDLKIFDPSGPFKDQRIHCLGVEKKLKSGAKCTLAARHPKVNSVKEIHTKELSCLTKEKILFIDNSKEHTEPVEKAGYPIILAEEGSSYFQTVIDAINATLENKWVSTAASKSTFFQSEERHETQMPTPTKSAINLDCK